MPGRGRTIVALDAQLVAPSGRAGVFADVVLRATRGEGRTTRLVPESHTRRAEAAAVTALDGTSVRLDFEHVEVVGAPSVFTVRLPHIEAPTRESASAAGPEADRLEFGERIVEHGARVMMRRIRTDAEGRGSTSRATRTTTSTRSSIPRS